MTKPRRKAEIALLLEEGRAAFVAGHHRRTNPYRGNMNASHWLAGYGAAEYEARVAVEEQRQQVFVICQNDFPVGVLTSKDEAQAWCDEGRRQNDARGPYDYWIAFHWHEFKLGEEPQFQPGGRVR